ncbi:MAG: EAL domain-containing protein [Proteobacteria bacterium]|nr:EAL domain-containing protein [Pseudomonadota bacterium]
MRAIFALPVGDAELARSQLDAFSKQIPRLYLILSFNAIALAVTHARTAPLYLTLYVPLLLCGLCTVRAIFWRRLRVDALSAEEAVDRLRTTMYLVAVLGLTFTVWSLSLYPYGGAFAKCHVAFYMSITVISCILCLMHLRGAALLLTAIVVTPFTIFFLITGNMVLIAMVLNLILVTGGLIGIMLRNYDDFAGLVRSRRVLIDRQQQMQALSDENLRLAYSDSLTGLPNRRSFLTRLDKTILAARRDSTRFAVALLDLDGFKSVNDVYGHAAGDDLLVIVGRRLESAVSPNIFLARLGGDEFGVILTGFSSNAEVMTLGRDILALLRAPCILKDKAVAVAGSIGVAIYPEVGQTAEDLFERADYALYFGKQTQKGQVIIFSESHAETVRLNGRIEQALRRADFEAEMDLVYQPIVDSITNRIIGFEALARWHNPEIGLVSPHVFLPLAERRQLIGQITETLLRKALRAAQPWPPHFTLSFNLSTRDLINPGTMTAVREMVIESGIEPDRVEFEITETAAIEDFAEAFVGISQLRALGARITLDDFGAGFSSLGHLLRLKLDKIKIDGRFVRDIDRSDAASSIIRSVVNLCRDLDIACVVEGVETEEQRVMLEELGCRLMQGYLFSRPIPASAIAALMASDAEMGVTLAALAAR